MTPFIRTDADGLITAASDKRSVDLSGVMQSLRNGTIAASAEIAHHSSASLTSSLGAEQADVIRVNLVAGVTYTFSLSGTATDGIEDPYFAIFAPDKSFITEDDDGGQGRGSQITYTPTVSGEHFLYATSWYHVDPSAPGFPTYVDAGNYTINMWAANPAHDAPDTVAGAVAIGVGTTYAHIEAEGDQDVYAVQVTAGNVYTFSYSGGVSGQSDFDGEPGENVVFLERISADGTILDSSLNYESSLSYYAEESGTIYLRTDPFYGTGGYTLNVQEQALSELDPLDTLDWVEASNVPFVDVGGVKTAYVYFGDSDENFGQTADDGGPMVTIDWNDYEKGQVMKALEEFEKVLGVSYEITTDSSKATFRLLKTESEDYGAYFIPRDPSFGPDQGVGVFNVLSGGWSFGEQQSLEKGGFSFAVILHEFGHAHGLAHPHDTGGGSEVMPGVTEAIGTLGVFDLNQGVYTVMSYNDAWVKHPDGPSAYTGAGIDNGWSGTLSAFDIAVLQRRYGVNQVNTGDDTYQLADTVQDAFYQTILDADGVDTIAYAGARDTQIDLTAATLDYSATGGGVVSFVRNATGTPSNQQIKGGYTIANGVVIENATGGSGNDVLIGNSVGNKLTGNAGDDFLMGNVGADILDGGAGFDTASYRTATAGVTVTLANNGKITVTGGDSGDTLIAIEAVEGSDHADVFNGGSNKDTLFGLGGDDSMSGGNGHDKLDGGAGNDSINGGSGNDQLVGGAGVDTIIGGTGVDIIDGGGAGGDILTGNTGADMFIFQSAEDIGSAPGERDVIKDFQAGLDKIDLSGLFSSAEAQAGFSVITNGSALGAYDIKVTSGGGTTTIIGDVDGDAVSDFTLELTGNRALKASDFVVNQTQWDAFFAKHGLAADYGDFHL